MCSLGSYPKARDGRIVSGVWFCLGILLVLMVFVPACAKSPVRPIPSPLGGIPAVDASPVWSRDGHLIAFHRRVFSSAGPPGVYVVPSTGGAIRYVAPADFFWPVNLRFSPDGRRLVCVYELQLYIVDIPTASFWNLIYTENGANYPDWSPDGRYIIYSRVFWNPIDWPVDTAGIHCLDLVTGQDHVIRADSTLLNTTVYGGRYPLWSPDGSQVAFIQTRVDGHNIVLMRPDGTGYRVLAMSPSGHTYDYLHWYARPARGIEGLVFRQISGPGAGPYYVGRNKSQLRRFEYPFRTHEAFSPDGEWTVRTGIDPTDSVSVLFVQRIDDVTGASRRQLTYWNPPDSLPRLAPSLKPMSLSLFRRRAHRTGE